MTLLLVAALRSLVTASMAFALWALVHRRSAAVRHWVLAGGIVATAVVVPLSFLVPQWHIVPASVQMLSPVEPATRDGAGVAGSGNQEAAVQAAEPAPWASPSAFVVMAALWGVGAAAGLGLLLIRLRHLGQLSATAETIVDGRWRALADDTAREYGIARPIVIRRTQTPDIVATWGLRTPVVLVPQNADAWDQSWVSVVLRHELAHIRRHDWAVQMLSETARAVLWFNPVLWVLCSRLRRESECACDDMVLRSGVPVQTYASHLIDIARACRGVQAPLPALQVAAPSTLERRITMLLKDRDRRLPPVWAMSVILAGMLIVGAGVASVGVLAQATTGRLVGHVYDTSGAVLPGVEVVLESSMQAKWPTMTDSSGRFEFTPVSDGEYTLSIQVPGFRTLRDQFELGSTSNWNRSITLQVGELEETIMVTARRPNPRQAPATSASEPVRIGGNIKPPRKTVNVPPVYPQAMRDAGLEGVVPLEAIIAEDGSVASVRVLSAQVHPEFAHAAEAAVRQWRFSQTLLNGVPVEVRMAVSVRFGLTD